MPSSLDSPFPIAVPETNHLLLSDGAFEDLVRQTDFYDAKQSIPAEGAGCPSPELVESIIPESDWSTAVDPSETSMATPAQQSSDHRFIAGLKTYRRSDEGHPDLEGMMLTENSDMALRSAGNPLVDLFFELEDVASGATLRGLLERAWAHDDLATLKLIFNARSIHLGKASRKTFYRCCGWLAQHHPKSLLLNLQWIVRPVIEQPKGQPKEDDGNSKMLTAGAPDGHGGMAHGYWKDLLNVLALAVNGELTDACAPEKVLNVNRQTDDKKRKSEYNWDQASAKIARDARKVARHDNAVACLNDNTFYRLLHLSITRCFAQQLVADKAVLSAEKPDLHQLSLAAKWAPTLGGFHDQHTFVASSIAERIYPKSSYEASVVHDRETYLKHAREDYRRLTISPLRKALEVVECDITAKAYERIKYSRVPSLAMNRYSSLFIAKDFNRFDNSLPSTLIHAVGANRPVSTKGKNALVAQKEADLQARVADAQWKALCQRIKDSGSLASSIAVCDVSGSMMGPTFPDGTCPVDSAIGLSLLLAEVTQAPFGGHFITFSANPEFLDVGGADDKRSLADKASYIRRAPWGMNTDFVAVFERLILPMAIKNNLKQDEMVKQVFVFSDMQFDAAGRSDHIEQLISLSYGGNKRSEGWSSSFERIKRQFADAGYEMPKLIFWNLAGGRAGYLDGAQGDPTAPKPVSADEEGTSLVSGYSQGQLKMFLDNGQFEEPDVEIEGVEEVDSDGDTVVRVSKKQKMDPLSTVERAISHKAYSMLKVID